MLDRAIDYRLAERERDRLFRSRG